MSDVVNNSNIDCLQGNTTYITLTFGSGDICRIALKAVNITLIAHTGRYFLLVHGSAIVLDISH